MSLKTYPAYKVTNSPLLGVIPSHWKAARLGTALNIKKDIVGDAWSRHLLLSLTLKGVIPRDMENRVGKLPADFTTYQRVVQGDLIFCLFDVEETPRTVGWVPEPGMITGAYTAAYVNPSFDARYIAYHYLSYDQRKSLRGYYAGLRNTIRSTDFSNIPIAYPPIDEQQTIASYLDRETAEIDAFIAEQEELIVLLAERRVATITQAVTKGLHPDTPMKDSGDKWLGRVPENWSVVSVSRFVRFGNGSDYKHVEVTDGGYPVIGSGGEFRRASEYLFDGESVLFGRKGTVDKPLHVNGKFWTVDTMYFTRIDVQKVLPKFLYYWALRFPFDFYVTNTALPSMTQTDLGSAKMGLPSLEDQEVISAYLDGETAKIDAAIADAREAIALSKERRAGVIDAAVTGKINVRGFVAPAIMEEGTSVGVE